MTTNLDKLKRQKIEANKRIRTDRDLLMSACGINEIEASHYGLNYQLLSNLFRLQTHLEYGQSNFDCVFNESIEDVIMISELMWSGRGKEGVSNYSSRTLDVTEEILYLRRGEWTEYYKQKRLHDLHNDFIHCCMDISTTNHPSWWFEERMLRYSKEEYSENEANFVDEWTWVNATVNNKFLMDCAADFKRVPRVSLIPRLRIERFYQSYLNEKKNNVLR